MSNEKLYYLYESRELWFRSPDIDRLLAGHPNAWEVWSTRSDEYRYVYALRPVESEPTLEWEGLYRASGGGYGVPVRNERARVVGYAYTTYPACPGVHAYLGKLLWPRSPLADPAFIAPATPEEMRAVTREGDAFPERACTPGGFDTALNQLNGLQARFV